MPEPVKGDQKYLPGLDGLRALAVAAVVAYHLGYGWAQGGLLGVGVFFTLSGYLITDILVGQWAARGRIKLGDFWLRRARRLLPALFVMLAVVTVWVNVVARSFLPGFRGNVIASVFYVSNWWYIGQHASYYARFAPPTPLDHLWSLAVEEQFYLIWPWVVLLLVWLAGRLRRRRRGLVNGPGGLGHAPVAGPGGGAPYLANWSRFALALRHARPRGRLRDPDDPSLSAGLRPDAGVRGNGHAGLRPADRRGGRDDLADPPGRGQVWNGRRDERRAQGARGRAVATGRGGCRRACRHRAAGVADEPVLGLHVPWRPRGAVGGHGGDGRRGRDARVRCSDGRSAAGRCAGSASGPTASTCGTTP